jgi:hypothetical protein
LGFRASAPRFGLTRFRVDDRAFVDFAIHVTDEECCSNTVQVHPVPAAEAATHG